MWFIGVEVEQETSAPPRKKNPGSAPVLIEEEAMSLTVFYSCICTCLCRGFHTRVNEI